PAIYTLSLHDALPIFRALRSKLWASCQTKEQSRHQARFGDRFLSFRTAQRNKIGKQPIGTRNSGRQLPKPRVASVNEVTFTGFRSEEHTSELQSLAYL